MRERRAVLPPSAVQRIVPRGNDPLQIRDDSGIDLIRTGAREIGGDFAVLRRERGDLSRRQRPDAGPLHAERRRPERLPPLPLFLDEPFSGDGDAAGGASLGARCEPATAFALLLGEDRDEIALQVSAAPRDALLEA